MNGGHELKVKATGCIIWGAVRQSESVKSPSSSKRENIPGELQTESRLEPVKRNIGIFSHTLHPCKGHIHNLYVTCELNGMLND